MAEIDPNAMDALAVLIDCMEGTPPLSSEDASRLHREHWQRVLPVMLEDGKNYGEASGGALSFLHNPDSREYIRSIAQDLDAHVGIVSDSFRDYLATAEIPAPHYALRVCIILKRGQRRDLELRFLRAWAKHFDGRGVGVTYGKLADRFAKLNCTPGLG